MPYAYERDPSLTRLETSVVASGEDEGRPFVVLADTVLYPEGGGQPADRGTIAGVRVVDVQKVADEIRHFVSDSLAAEHVTVELEWSRRFDHMQQHTGQHLLTAIAEERFGWRTTAFHLGETVSDIELDTPEITSSELVELEEAVAVEVRAARAVTTRRVSAEEYADMPVRSRGLPAGHSGSVRLVEIEGVDVNTCGGTHLSSTAELEALKLLGREPVRGGTRLFYVAGARLRRLHGAHHERNAALRSLIGVADDELVTGVEAKIRQLKEAKRALRATEEELASAWAEGLASRPDRVLVAHWPERTLPFLQQVARELVRVVPDRAVLLTCGGDDDGAFVVAAGDESEVDVATTGARIAEILAGRGGGSGAIYQGRASDLSRRQEAVAVLG